MIERAHTEAMARFEHVSPISEPAMNGYQSFFIPPDGSKEGWTDSDVGDQRRASFILRLDELRYEDGSNVLNWVEVQYGDDNRETIVTAHSDELERWEGRG
jgi:hypothetical protein